MTHVTSGECSSTTPFAPRPGLPLAASGLLGLAAVMAPLPFLDDENVSSPEQALSYVLAILPSGALVYGLLASLDAHLPRTPRLLPVGAAVGVGCALAAYPGGRPEDLGVPAALPLALLLLADALRIAAAVSLALARQVTSPGTALLVAASASDLFSVFAGPTRALVREDAPILDFLLLIFPTFGYPLGFALGVADLVFLTLFVALAAYLALKPLTTLVLGCVSILLAMLAGLLLGTALPALPFIALLFLAANALPLYRSLFTSRKPR